MPKGSTQARMSGSAAPERCVEHRAAAVKHAIARQIGREMTAQHITKTMMAARMHTSRAALNRLLDMSDTGLTLATLTSAASALGARLNVELVRR